MIHRRLLVATFVLCPATAAVAQDAQTKVVRVAPRDKATDVDVQAPLQIHFSNGLKLATITADSVRLLNSAGMTVPAKLGSDIEGDVVNLQPTRRLLPRTTYTIEVNDKLIDKDEVAVAPFRSSFTTGDDVPLAIPKEGFRFTKTKVDDEHGPTAIAVGPDGNVYVSTYNGIVYRLRIDPQTGMSIGKEKLLTLAGRKILGLAFDPEATASDLIAWITYDDRKAEQVDTGTFSGVVSRLVIPAAGQGSREGNSLHHRLAVGVASAQRRHVRSRQAAVRLRRQHESPGRRSDPARDALELGGRGRRRPRPGLQRRPPAAQRADDGAGQLRSAGDERTAEALCHRLSPDVSPLLALERKPLRRREPERRHRPGRYAESSRSAVAAFGFPG